MLGREYSCGFTGYRPEKHSFWEDETSQAVTQLKAELVLAVEKAAAQGFRQFICGMSRGFDLWAAEAVLSLSPTLGIYLVAAVPFWGQEKNWDEDWRHRYANALEQARFNFTLESGHGRSNYLARNRFIVDNSAKLICYYDGKAGGTAYTVRYAVKNKLEIDNLAYRQESIWAYF